MTAASLAPRQQQIPAPTVCPACSHRLALHGFLLRETWCLAWDGERLSNGGSGFCGCTVLPQECAPLGLNDRQRR